MPAEAGALVISLDFELHWGVRDVRPVAAYRDNLLGVRAAVPALLRLFAEFEVHATWATVGFLCCEDKRELLDALPSRRPAYVRPELSPYGALGEVGEGERDDPFHFAPSLVRLIAEAPHQEIGTHTLSHYYCLEPGQSPEDFRADLSAALRLMRRKLGRVPRSIVFPRNQVAAPYVQVCGEAGLVAYRGNRDAWAYRSRAYAEESPVRRAVRLADAYLPLTGPGARQPRAAAPGEPVDVTASRYLRPYAPSLRRLERLRLHRITADLRRAARNGAVFHLWWHPHDFGVHLRENLEGLTRVLRAFVALRERHGMLSLTMAEAAAHVRAAGMPDRMARAS